MANRKRGEALVIGLLLLLVATVLGVASMSQSTLQEKAAANQKASTLTFLAAEAGLHTAIRLLNQGKNASGVTGAHMGVNWQTLVTGVCNQKAGCIVQSTATDANTGARRMLQLDYRSGSLAPINIIGDIGIFDAAKSEAFKVQGGPQGAAIATNTAANRDKIITAIGSRMGSYTGGVVQTEFDSPFDDPKKMADFIAEVEDSIVPGQNDGSITRTPSGGFVFNIGTPSKVGPPAVPAVAKITVYTATDGLPLVMSGSVSGAGILIVKGDLQFNGTPNFEGLLIVTGKSFTVSGGGAGGIFGGAVVFANPVETAPGIWKFGDATADFRFDVSGGGTADFRYSIDALVTARGLLNTDAQGMWSPIDSDFAGRVKGWSEVVPN